MTQSSANATSADSDDIVRLLAVVDFKIDKIVGIAATMIVFILLSITVYTVKVVVTTVQERNRKKQKTTLVISLDVEESPKKKKKLSKKEKKQAKEQRGPPKCSHRPMVAAPSKTMTFSIDAAVPPTNKPWSRDPAVPLSFTSTSTQSTTHMGNTPEEKTPEKTTPEKKTPETPGTKTTKKKTPAEKTPKTRKIPKKKTAGC